MSNVSDGRADVALQWRAVRLKHFSSRYIKTAGRAAVRAAAVFNSLTISAVKPYEPLRPRRIIPNLNSGAIKFCRAGRQQGAAGDGAVFCADSARFGQMRHAPSRMAAQY